MLENALYQGAVSGLSIGLFVLLCIIVLIPYRIAKQIDHDLAGTGTAPIAKTVRNYIIWMYIIFLGSIFIIRNMSLALTIALIVPIALWIYCLSWVLEKRKESHKVVVSHRLKTLETRERECGLCHKPTAPKKLYPYMAIKICKACHDSKTQLG
jgi:hypothetical protein